MSATLHVRCPICKQSVDSVIETETWGESIPGDFGCGNVTLMGPAMSEHVSNNHTTVEILLNLLEYYQAQALFYQGNIPMLKERVEQIAKEARA